MREKTRLGLTGGLLTEWESLTSDLQHSHQDSSHQLQYRLSQSATELEETMAAPEQCFMEMKTNDREKLTISLLSPNLSAAVLSCEMYNSLAMLLWVTAHILKFVNAPHRVPKITPTADKIHLALAYCLKISQLSMPEMKKCEKLTNQFGLLQDSSGLW